MRLNVNEQAMATTGVDTASQHSPLQLVFPWVIFDMDGTLVDTFQLNLRSFNYAVKRTLTAEEVLGMPSGTLEEELASYVPLADVPRAIERYHAHYKSHFNSETRVFPGIRALLFRMHARGIRLAVCTGASRQIAEFTLALSGLSHYFPTIATGDDVDKPKPDPEGLRIAMEKIDACSGQTVYVGDHPNDIRAARSMSTQTAAAKWGSMHRSELQDLKPDFLFKDPFDALTLSGFRS
jgi:pyrophosphatase PpaX